MKDKQLDIDMKRTGLQIKSMVLENGYSVKDIQDYLYLSCPQSIYRWFRGEALPSVDNLYRLSVLLKVHMEAFLVNSVRSEKMGDCETIYIEVSKNICRIRNLYKFRLQSYYQMIAA